MTYGEFKTDLTAVMSGEVKVPEDTILKVYVRMGIEEIAHHCIPLSLVESSPIHKPLRYLNDTRFIRIPNAPSVDGDILDIDENLTRPLVFLVASYIVKENSKKREFKQNYMLKLNEHNFRLYGDFEDD